MQEYVNYLLDGNERLAIQFLERNQFRSKKEIFEEIITPAMQHIGQLWEMNKITVADEHLATGICDYLISRLYPPAQQEETPKSKKAMFFCVEGERHYLGLKMANLLFEESGWETRYYGPDLPLEYAVAKAENWKPDVVGISVSIVYNLPIVKDYITSLTSLKQPPKVLVGGRIASKYQSSLSLSKVEIFEGLTELETWLRLYRTGGRTNVYQ
ncbi:hypothetical protein AM500_16665 [Bacillus sp. FJAT-18017]|nr:hypothetical protein AM500_16665 [Bacillus sp. FJAT-18017]